MNLYADFHCHSTNSDGKYEIEQVINIARKANIKYLALTDHNKLMPDFDLYQQKNPDIVLIKGSEISSVFRFPSGKKIEIHIIGLFLEDTKEMQGVLMRNNQNNEAWLKKIIFRLKEIGIDVGSYEEIQKSFPGRQVRRMLLAEYMVQKKLVPSIDVALNTYIGDRGKRLAWEPCTIEYVPYAQVINAIHKSNGLAILAHPLSYVLTEVEQQQVLTEFRNAGGDAIEIFYAAYSEEQKKQLKNQADALALGYSCGSDYHGYSKTETMDNRFPAEIYNQLLRLKKKVL